MTNFSHDALKEGGLDAPLTIVDDIDEFHPSPAPGANRYRHTLANGAHLDSLLINKNSMYSLLASTGPPTERKMSSPGSNVYARF